VTEIRILPATLAHAAALAPRLRPADEAEVRALGERPYEALRTSIARGLWAEAYLVDDEVAAIVGLGLSSFAGGHGVPWLLTSPLVDRHRKTFLRCSRATLARMLAETPLLVNWVHAENLQAIRWLRWLGFDVSAEPVALPPHGAPFHRFQIERPVGQLKVRPFHAGDLLRVRILPVFEGARPLLTGDVAAALERCPSFTGEIAGRVVGCAGWLPTPDGAVEAWALFDRRSGPHMLGIVRACAAMLGKTAGPVRALIDTAFEPSRRLAEMLGFVPTGQMSRSPDGRNLQTFIRS